LRDELLKQHVEVEWLFACAERVIVDECQQYREKKRSWLGRPVVEAETQGGPSTDTNSIDASAMDIKQRLDIFTGTYPTKVYRSHSVMTYTTRINICMHRN
jgi:hypothetical protein